MNRKILFPLFVAAFAATACEEDFPTREESPVESPSSMKIEFAKSDTTYTLGNADNSFVIDFRRSSANLATTVRLDSYLSDEVFNIPSEVSFANGETSAQITVGLRNDFKLFNRYNLYLVMELDGGQSNFYSADATAPQFATTVMKEDYVLFDHGSFDSPMLGSWDEQPILRSEANNSYRFLDLIEQGYSLDIQFNKGSDKYFKVTTGEAYGTTMVWNTGVSYGSMGSLSTIYSAEELPDGDYYHGTYADGVFTFVSCEYRVSDMSFGKGYTETLVRSFE